MKKGVVLLISAIAFGGILSTGLTSCTTVEVERPINPELEIQAATVKIFVHGDFATCTIDSPKETYKEGDTIKLNLAFVEGYGLDSATLNEKPITDTNSITLEAGTNVINIYVKNLVVTEGTTNLRDFQFEEIEGGKAYAITSYTPTGIYPTIAQIPGSYLGKPVKEIKYVTETTELPDGGTDTIVKSRYLFGGLKGVHIPASVTKIDVRAFRSNSTLKTITVDEANTTYSSDGTVLLSKDKTTLLAFPQGNTGSYKVPDSVTKIGDDAFYGATKLSSIDLNKITEIGKDSFNSIKGIKEIVIPNTVTKIGEGAFSTAVEVEKLTLSNQLTEIPLNAFYKNSSLTSVTIPASVKSLQKYAFYDCTSLKEFKMEEGLTDIGDNAISHTLIETLDFPSTLRTIGVAACAGNDRLTKVTFKEGITKLGKDSFYRNLRLESINIPASLTEIGDGAFFATLSLTGFDVAEGNEKFEDIDGVLFEKGNDIKKLVAYPSNKPAENKTYEIPEGTTELGYQCFGAVSNNPEGESSKPFSITKIIMPTSVKQMNDSFNLALINRLEYKGTSAEFKQIKELSGQSWDATATNKINLVCLGDKQ